MKWFLLAVYFAVSALACLGSATGAICFAVGWVATAVAWAWYDLWNRYYTVPTLKLSPSAKRGVFCALCALGICLFGWRFVAGLLEVGRPYLYQGAALATPVAYITSKMYGHGWTASEVRPVTNS